MADCCDGMATLFDDGWAERELRAHRRRGLPSRTRALVSWLVARGVTGCSVLDVGAGIGAIHLSLLQSGADRAVDVDLAPACLAAARLHADQLGLRDRVTYVEGDLVEQAPRLEPADLVVLDRVVCCYPDPDRLLTAIAGLTTTRCALVYPRSGALLRGLVALLNGIRRPFGATVFFHAHPRRRLEQILTSGGLDRRSYDHVGLFWRVTVYEKGAA